MAHSAPLSTRILLIDPAELRREMLARRLEAQGYVVEQANSGADGAEMALSEPPAVVVADLWMPGVSGVQLCRLLRSEPATAHVPVVLCAEGDEPRNRFWAEHAGAAACAVKGRTAELVRLVAKAVESRGPESDFFVQLSGGSVDIRDRVSKHLDAALFDSVIAGEVRSLASAGTFERLFDSLAQLLSRVVRYRWVALSTSVPDRVAIHRHPGAGPAADAEARTALGASDAARLHCIEDEDAHHLDATSAPSAHDVTFGGAPVGRFAISFCGENEYEGSSLGEIVARELGGPLKMIALIEESQRQASLDPLTGLMNRRAFAKAVSGELARCRRYGHPMSLALLDVDHFKRINDTRGHAGGDRVLAALGHLLQKTGRTSDFCGRWGGEEFVVAYAHTNLEGAAIACERLREAVERLNVCDEEGKVISVTVSVGCADLSKEEELEALLDRADRAMYESKAHGRNRVTLSRRDGALSRSA